MALGWASEASTNKPSLNWRREWDSNPRCLATQRFSRPSDSSTLASLQLGFRASKPFLVLVLAPIKPFGRSCYHDKPRCYRHGAIPPSWFCRGSRIETVFLGAISNRGAEPGERLEPRQAEAVPPSTDRGPNLLGRPIRLGSRMPAVHTCRDGMLAALVASSEPSGRQPFTARGVFA